MNNIDIITVLGPTATGKTHLAVQLAHHLDSEIISADSRQVYRGMDIGTGKDLSEYFVDEYEIKHHLVDIAEPGTEYNVYSFQEDFLKAYRDIKTRGKVPVLCGGTGLYLDSVLMGYQMKQVPANEDLRASLAAKSLDALIQILQSYGPLHNTTDITDRERCIRAIEIWQFEKDNPVEPEFPKLNSLNIGIRLERQEVRDRITRRLKERLENGMIEEIQGLLDSGLKPEQLQFYGLEYRYVTDYVTGRISYQELFEQLNTAIHQFSKRQMTWFRRMEKRGVEIHWIDGLLPDEDKVKQCLKWMGL
ncbi:MAG: tRNA (adenosine(37)-N6)-dimethylallyltransferase MiaA [Bacteroidales bacterium]|nr:tRNA (adenosine(37)-N6)-dimethylallyltransferase MiaA [Bacteroidales bacterium]